MASIATEPNGRRRILFMIEGKRRTIRLGKLEMKQAREVLGHVEHLLAVKKSGRDIRESTEVWLRERDDVFHEKLASAGLVDGRESSSPLIVGPFIDKYIADRTDAKPRTIINLKAARGCLVKFFGANKPMRQVTLADAKQFRRYLLRDGQGENTVRRICGRAKQFFKVAEDMGRLKVNPFRDKELPTKVRSMRDRQAFIGREDFAKVLNACPSTEWKVIFALARFGGLRCPSEVLTLKWTDINFDAGTMLIHSPKTEHHSDGGRRLVPLFADLRPLLMDAFEHAADGTVYVVGRSRDDGINLRTQAERIIERAGVVPWPKLFVNLRASRATELASEYPGHVCAKWLGHTEAIADEFYRQVRDEDFQRAIGESAGVGTVAQGVAQKVAQRPSETVCKSQNSATHQKQKHPVLQGVSASCNGLQKLAIPPRGVVTTAEFAGNSTDFSEGGAEGGAVDLDLAEICLAWPSLPTAMRSGIMATVRGAASD